MTASLDAEAQGARFAAAWTEAGRRWRHLVGWYVGGLVVGSAVHLLRLGPVRSQGVGTLVLLGKVLWLVGIGHLLVRHAGFRCPLCREAFCGRGFSWRLYTRRCVHCGMTRGTLPAASGLLLTGPSSWKQR